MVAGSSSWDPNSIATGLTGSEEAVIYVSDKLAQLGYLVTILGNPPLDSSYGHPNSNPRYIPISQDDGSVYDIAIAWRQPYIGLQLRQRAHQVYLWPHDTYHSLLNEEDVTAFDDVLWISEWQRLQWISVNPSFARYTTISGNGINTADFPSIIERKNPYSCIYGSNYARGLEILLDIWPQVKMLFPQATLDIYYGWQHWGLLTPEKEAKMRAQVEQLAVYDVVEHGLVSHQELNQAYSKASFWTYPCIAPEVFCITALKAQYAGAIPVIIDGSALPETVLHGHRTNQQKLYLSTLILAMRDAKKINLQQRIQMRAFIDEKYTWEKIALQWKGLFDHNR